MSADSEDQGAPNQPGKLNTDRLEPLLLTSREAGKLLGLAPHSLENHRRYGTGPPFVSLGPSCVRYKLSDLKKWCAELPTHQKSLPKK